MRLWRKFSLLVVPLGFVLAFGAAGATNWEIVPKTDLRIPLGKVAVVQGQAIPEGVLFVLNNLNLSTPVQVTLSSEDAQPLEFAVYKESPQQPLLLRSTTRQHPVTFRFRTNRQVYFSVKGAGGSHYQLLTWVGPEVQIAAPPTFMPMAEYLAAQAPVSRTRPESAAAALPAASPADPGATVSSGKWIPILLALILVSLVVIIILLLRRRRSAAGAAVLLLALGAHTAAAQEGVPKHVEAGKENKEVQEAWNSLRETLELIKKGMDAAKDTEGLKLPWKKEEKTTTAFAHTNRFDMWSGEPMSGAVTMRVSAEPGEEKSEKPNRFKIASEAVEKASIALAFLEQFGFIDKREAAVQPNFSPQGIPPLPSQCQQNKNCGKCFNDAMAQLEKSHHLLETQYVIYKQTELEAGRILELANAAAGMNPYIQATWTIVKTSPQSSQNVAQARFYASYDGNLDVLLRMMNDALIALGDCERQEFNEQDWFNRYGMPYYLFMRERYARK